MTLQRVITTTGINPREGQELEIHQHIENTAHYCGQKIEFQRISKTTNTHPAGLSEIKSESVKLPVTFCFQPVLSAMKIMFLPFWELVEA